MTIIAGVDFGTQSVRVTIFDTVKGVLTSEEAPLKTRADKIDLNFATQRHEEHLKGLRDALAAAQLSAAIDLKVIKAIAFDTTGSSIIPVAKGLEPLDDYYLWRDHRAFKEAKEITELAHKMNVQAIKWCGGIYSHEWGFSKLLHWLRNNPNERGKLFTALEHCDMLVNTLVGNVTADSIIRSKCAIGHKWLWNENLGGLPDQEFFSTVDPLFDGIRDKMVGEVRTSNHIAGHLTPHWADYLGLSAGIPIPVGAFDAHWDAIGVGGRVGDMVNIVGTSTCVIAIMEHTKLIEGVCGVVDGSADPDHVTIEAGLSAVGDLFSSIAQRANTSINELSNDINGYSPGQSGLLRVPWDNGDRSVLVRADLSGITFGWKLGTTAQDELFAAIEGTAFLNKIILDRIEESGESIKRIINTGGVSSKNRLLNQIYADVFNKPVYVPQSDPTGLGACIFAGLASGDFASIYEAQKVVSPDLDIYKPRLSYIPIYNDLFRLFEHVYFGMEKGNLPSDISSQLSEIRNRALRLNQNL